MTAQRMTINDAQQMTINDSAANDHLMTAQPKLILSKKLGY
jgi:hypothetical protein